MYMKRVPAKSIKEVVERMRALHVDAMAAKFPASTNRSWGHPMDPQLEFKCDAHEEMDLLMLDAFEILGQRDIVEARKVVEKSYDGRFWYA